nr:phage tail protein I [uncultured Cellulosilyticum sp.]
MVDESISFKDLLPISISHDANIQAACQSLDQELGKLRSCIDTLSILPNITNASEEIVDLLALQFDVPHYEESLSIDKKRELVKKAIAWHKKKGTVGAVEEIVSLIFGESTIEEWYEYGGKPHHFRITTTNISVDDSFIERFKIATEKVKRKSAWLDEVIVTLASEFNFYTGFVVHTAETIIIEQEG